MAWTEPKTDWSVGTSTTDYNGDRFTYEDFNRIKNNIAYMYTLARQVFDIDDEISRREADPSYYFTLQDGYADRTITSFVYADEINYFENRLDYLNEVCGNIAPGTKKTYYDNSKFIDATELNRLENQCLVIEDFLYKMFTSKRRLAFTLSQATNHIDL